MMNQYARDLVPGIFFPKIYSFFDKKKVVSIFFTIFATSKLKTLAMDKVFFRLNPMAGWGNLSTDDIKMLLLRVLFPFLSVIIFILNIWVASTLTFVFFAVFFLFLLAMGRCKALVISREGITLVHPFGSDVFVAWNQVGGIRLIPYEIGGENVDGIGIVRKGHCDEADTIQWYDKEVYVMYIPFNRVAEKRQVVADTIIAATAYFVDGDKNVRWKPDSSMVSHFLQAVSWTVIIALLVFDIVACVLQSLPSDYYDQLYYTLIPQDRTNYGIGEYFSDWIWMFSTFFLVAVFPFFLFIKSHKVVAVVLPVFIALSVYLGLSKLDVRTTLRENLVDKFTSPVDSVETFVFYSNVKPRGSFFGETATNYGFTYCGVRYMLHGPFINSARESMPAMLYIQKGGAGLPVVTGITIEKAGYKMKNFEWWHTKAKEVDTEKKKEKSDSERKADSLESIRRADPERLFYEGKSWIVRKLRIDMEDYGYDWAMIVSSNTDIYRDRELQLLVAFKKDSPKQVVFTYGLLSTRVFFTTVMPLCGDIKVSFDKTSKSFHIRKSRTIPCTWQLSESECRNFISNVLQASNFSVETKIRGRKSPMTHNFCVCDDSGEKLKRIWTGEEK